MLWIAAFSMWLESARWRHGSASMKVSPKFANNTGGKFSIWDEECGTSVARRSSSSGAVGKRQLGWYTVGLFSRSFILNTLACRISDPSFT